MQAPPLDVDLGRLAGVRCQFWHYLLSAGLVVRALGRLQQGVAALSMSGVRRTSRFA